MPLTRRDFAKLSLSGAAVVGGGAAARAAPAVSGRWSRPAALPASKGPRTVVVGGGWSGLTLARSLKALAPDMDVVLVERRATFVSLPLGNLWMAGLVGLEDLVFSFLDAARAGGFRHLEATVIALDRDTRTVTTDAGTLTYDFLVLAPGIGYDYGALGVDDPEAAAALATRYPAAAATGSELATLRRKVGAFAGGLFVVTVPPGNYRCAATPYERACLIAAVFARDRIKGKVVLIDPRDRPGVAPEAFLAAFAELHGDTLEYLPSTMIEAIDPDARTITTGFDQIAFDDACLYPRVRAAPMIEDFGLADPHSPQKEARIDRFRYNVIGDERVYVTGDARNQPFSKSGNTARTEAKYVAEVIAARAAGREPPPWRSPRTRCVSVVSLAPPEAIAVASTYAFDSAAGEWEFGERHHAAVRSAAMAPAALDWARGQFREMFF